MGVIVVGLWLADRRAGRVLAGPGDQRRRARRHHAVDHGGDGPRRHAVAVPGRVRRHRRLQPPRSSWRPRGCPWWGDGPSARSWRPPVGAVLAVPVVRLDGVYLALATLAFALMFESVLVPLGWVSGGVGPPHRCPDRCSDRSTSRTTAGSSCSRWPASPTSGVGVIRVREGTTGRYLQALHMSPRRRGVDRDLRHPLAGGRLLPGRRHRRLRRRAHGQLPGTGQLPGAASATCSAWCGWPWWCRPAPAACRPR